MTDSPSAAQLPSIDDVVSFWREAGPGQWFRKDDAFDARFRERFAPAHEAAAAGRLDHWAQSPDGTLALLILLDQFPRNAFRGTPRMFANDARALELAEAAVARGMDRQVDPALRGFFYLPFSHSEQLAHQVRAVALNADTGGTWLHFAQIHLDAIERFGRFPHRNALLGRHTTPDEQRYLDEGGFAG